MSAAVSGWRKPIRTEPWASRPISSAVGRGDLRDHVAGKAVAGPRACLLVGGVGVVSVLARAGLDGHLEPVLDEALDDLRHQCDTALTRGHFLGN